MPSKDAEYRRKYRREWYTKNKKSEKAHVKRRKDKLRKWFWDYKKKLKCSICGEKHPSTLEFHHKNNSKKDKNVCKMVCDGMSIKRILNEIKKCQILCSNCHKKKHYKIRLITFKNPL